VRVLIPLIGASLFAAALVGSLMAEAAGAAHHVYWRQILFGSCLLTLSAVTGLKYRQK